ncbi:Cytochrome P450 [Macleaya cordata]|uniref:Cytochrome P450 n=1 Tax=Macleaya cordata TaxID=56857 RepID=A0A200QAY5_MACCD|nr:Cytochrome P450 [Macleaya cordata]
MFIIIMWSVLSCLIALAIISLTHYVYRWRNPKCNGKLPPGSMGLPLIGESIQFFFPSKSFDIPQFFKKRIARYGTLFRTSLGGRPVVVSSDPEFNHFILQQEGKLVEMWYMDSLSSVFGSEVSEGANIGYIHKYTRNLVLGHLGTECLKQMLLLQMEVMVTQYLQSWSTKPSVELKESISTVSHSSQPVPYTVSIRLGTDSFGHAQE